MALDCRTSFFLKHMMTYLEKSSPSGLRRLRVLAGVCLASAAMPMTFTGPAVALRDIARSLGGSPVALAWVTNAFMLAFGSMLMVAGALADRHGRRKVFLAGVGVFVLASLALVGAPGIVAFDLLRALQGAASAAVFAGGAAALAQEFEGAERIRAFSMLGTSFGVGLTLGPVAAGWLSAALGWRSIFLLVIGCAVLAAAVAATALRESRDPQAQVLDWPGALAFTLALSLFTYGVLQAPDQGLRHPATAGALLASVLAFAGFVHIEQRAGRPMLDLSLFRYPRFVGVQLLAAAPAYGFVVLLVVLPIRFVGIEGLPAAEAGRWMACLSAPLIAVPLAAGLLAKRFSPAALCGTGLLLASAGLVWLGAAGSGTQALPPLVLIGAGMGLPWGLMDGLAVSVVPKERAGMATGIFSTTRVAGEGLALALVGAALSALVAHRLHALAPLPDGMATTLAQQLTAGDLGTAVRLWPALSGAEMAQAYQSAFSTLAWGLAGITLLTAGVVFAFLGRGAQPHAHAPMPGGGVRAAQPCRRVL